jgi:hypothetical protein
MNKHLMADSIRSESLVQYCGMGVLRIRFVTRTGELSLHFANVLVDVMFLALWAGINLPIQWGLKRVQFEGIEAVELVLLQLFIALFTVYPLALFLYRDFRILLIKSDQEIERARREQENA